MLHVVLYQPEIPPNTGNIARQSVGMNASLHIVGPVAFDMSKKAVRRAGLDYWQDLKLTVHDDPDEFLKWLGNRDPWIITKYGRVRYDRPDYKDEDILIFGNELRGIPREWIDRWQERTVYIPIPGNVRSYNLANTVSVILAHASLKAGIYDKAQDLKFKAES
jgi:tRNA (cytidine/uridine-2'-O-)-methyltransferase